MAVTLTDIVLAFRNHVATTLALSPNIIPIVVRKDVPNLNGDRDIIIRVRNFTADQSHTGRYDLRIRRLIDVTLRYRYAGDQVGNDLRWLTAEATGFLEFENAVLSAAHLFEPMDTPGNGLPLMVQPMRILNGSDPTKEVKSADGVTWGEETLTIEIIFDQPVEQSIQ